jgi:hypothetical protein
MKENKKGAVIGGIALLIFIGIITFRISNKHAGETVVVPEIPAVAETIAPATDTGAPVIRKPKPKLAYSEAVKLYDNGRRIQFNDACQTFPVGNMIANGTTIMLDNRSIQSRVITIGPSVYKVGSYSYELAKISAPKLPTTYKVNCDQQKNPTVIVVE